MRDETGKLELGRQVLSKLRALINVPDQYTHGRTLTFVEKDMDFYLYPFQSPDHVLQEHITAL